MIGVLSMLDKLLRNLDIEVLRNFLNKRIVEYLSSDSDLSDVLNDRNRIIDFISMSSFDDFLSEANLRVVLINEMPENDIKYLTKMLSIKGDKKSLLKYVYQEEYKGKFKKVLLEFLGMKPQKNERTEHEVYTRNDSIFYELLDYQYLIRTQILDSLQQEPLLLRMILHMPTGTGKTKTATHIVINNYLFTKKKKGVLLWLAHTKELLEQAYNAFLKTWTALGHDDIHIRFNSLDQPMMNSCIYFISYQKLISLLKRDDDKYTVLRKHIVGIVADEAHKCLAKETRNAIEGLMRVFPGDNNKYLLGLTATPGRKYGDFDDSEENILLANMFDKRIFSIDINKVDYLKMSPQEYVVVEKKDREIIKYFQKRGILSKIEREIITYKNNDEIYFTKKRNDTDFDNKILYMFSAIADRNKKIIEKLIQLDKMNTPTIVFACSVDHGKFLEQILNIKGISTSSVYGEMSNHLRESNIASFNKGENNILINFEVLTTGFDSPRIQCVFITRPTNSIVLYSQMLGRGLRGPKMGGNSTCLLIDIEDNFEKFSNENEAFSYFDEYWS